jgi:hypothetical protein
MEIWFNRYGRFYMLYLFKKNRSKEMKSIIMNIDVPIGDNLYLRVDNLKYTPGTPGYISGRPEDCYEAENSEVDWDDKDTYLVYKIMKIIKNGDKKSQGFVEHVYKAPDKFSDHYYDDIQQIADDEYESNR